MCLLRNCNSFIKQNKYNGCKARTNRSRHHHTDYNGKLDNNKRNYTYRKCLYYFTLAGVVVCTILVLSTLAVVILKHSKNTSDRSEQLKIISRKEWFAKPPKDRLVSLDLPVSRVIIAHTAMKSCTTQAKCVQLVQKIQKFHMESSGWDDIGYNFLVGGDGAIYVGRDWDSRGAHTKGQNTKSICFAFIGEFDTIEPPKRQLIAAQKMISEGVKLKKLTEDYALYGHLQFLATKSPGSVLYKIIQKWDHWTNDTRENDRS